MNGGQVENIGFDDPRCTSGYRVAERVSWSGSPVRIGDETLSRTSAFNLRHSEALSATTSSFICYLF